jgi:hypothetical protein
MKLMQAVFLWAATVLATGCGSTVPASQPVQSPRPVAPATPAPTQPLPEKDTRIIIDGALDRTLRVLGVKSSTGKDGILRIQVIVRNITTSPRWFSYRIEWFDENGAVLPMASSDSLPWMLMAGETSSFVATAPAVTAKDFGVAFLPQAK